jgi:hypothetical protein
LLPVAVVVAVGIQVVQQLQPVEMVDYLQHQVHQQMLLVAMQPVVILQLHLLAEMAAQEQSQVPEVALVRDHLVTVQTLHGLRIQLAAAVVVVTTAVAAVEYLKTVAHNPMELAEVAAELHGLAALV